MANPLRDRYGEMLLERIRRDKYPSTTHMDLLESVATGRLLVAYILTLMEKIEDERFPSIDMMKRVQRLIGQFG